MIQSSAPIRLTVVEGMDVHDSRVHNYPPRWNGAPSQELLVIRRNHQTGPVSLDPLRCGRIPYDRKADEGRSTPNARPCTSYRRSATPNRRRRCIVPVDGSFEWKAIAPFSRPIQCPKRESTISNGLG